MYVYTSTKIDNFGISREAGWHTVLSLTGKVRKKKHFSEKISSKYVEVVQNVTDRRKRFKSV